MSDIISQLESLGAPAALVEEMRRAPREDGAFAVWPENEQAVQTFCAMSTQWRMAPAGLSGSIPQGLEYSALAATMSLMGVPSADHPDLFRKIRVMESSALEAMTEGTS